MRAEELLREPERLERHIKLLVNEINYQRSTLLPGGIDYSTDKVQNSGSDRYPGVMDIILKDEELIRELNAKRLHLIHERIPALIAKIENEMARDVVKAYYTTDATMAEVCEICNISNMTGYRYRWMGLADIQKALDAES